MKMRKFPKESNLQKRISDPLDYISDDEEIIELDLNEEIEENENLLSELIEESPKGKNHERFLPKTKIQGYFNLHSKSLFGQNEVKKKFFKFSTETLILEYSEEKDSKITKKYFLKENDTLLLKGKEKDFYIIKIKQQGEETIQISTSIIEQYYDWLSIFEQCKIKNTNIQFTNQKSPRNSILLKNSSSSSISSLNEKNEKIENLDFIYWTNKNVLEWLKNILFFFLPKEEKILNQIIEIFEKKKLIGIDLNQKINLKKFFDLNEQQQQQQQQENLNEILNEIEDEINENITKLKLDRSLSNIF